MHWLHVWKEFSEETRFGNRATHHQPDVLRDFISIPSTSHLEPGGPPGENRIFSLVDEREGVVGDVFIEDADLDARCDGAKGNGIKSEGDLRTLDASVVNAPGMVSIDELVIEHVFSDSGDICWYGENEALSRTHRGPSPFEPAVKTSVLL
jgi:hypothetical protein